MSVTMAANCSILLSDLPIPERLALVRSTGIQAVEFWWPFATAGPTDEEVQEFVEAIDMAGLQLVALNLFAGDMDAGDRGVLSAPGRESELRASAEIACRIGQQTGCRVFNVLYGLRLAGVSDVTHDATAVENLVAVSQELRPIDGTIVIEALSGLPAYPLSTAADVGRVLSSARDAGAERVGMLLDVYHLHSNDDDVERVIDTFREDIVHVQVADAPGRGAPGTGDLPIDSWLARLSDVGYGGAVGLEFVAEQESALESLRRMAAR
ncbi:TIM barrel protein [Saccharomonospora sp. NPDC046836]|uniref:hydroxypyruvate isomerase family protein n=1 Tax=Saccharomonospora sp. NPDC046836 TaxID=3156921 RepID=UPI0033D5E590